KPARRAAGRHWPAPSRRAAGRGMPSGPGCVRERPRSGRSAARTPTRRTRRPGSWQLRWTIEDWRGRGASSQAALAARTRGRGKGAAAYVDALRLAESAAGESLLLAEALFTQGADALVRGYPDRAASPLERSAAIRGHLAPASLDTARSLSKLGVLAARKGDIE